MMRSPITRIGGLGALILAQFTYRSSMPPLPAWLSGCESPRMSPLVPLPESLVETGEHWLLAVNRNQNLLGKTMLILRRPCGAVVDIDAAEWAALHADLLASPAPSSNCSNRTR